MLLLVLPPAWMLYPSRVRPGEALKGGEPGDLDKRGPHEKGGACQRAWAVGPDAAGLDVDEDADGDAAVGGVAAGAGDSGDTVVDACWPEGFSRNDQRVLEAVGKVRVRYAGVGVGVWVWCVDADI